jgi:subtilisin-like proprotein convertase family protein
MLYRRSATRWPARMLGLALITGTSLFLAVGTASAQPAAQSNTTQITIPGSGSSGNGSPYPSTINVAGLTGAISKATVTLNGFAHQCSIDVDVLLVGPGGQSSILTSDAGDCANETTLRPGVNLTFDDSAPNVVPCLDATSTPTRLPAGTYKPTDYSPPTNGVQSACDPSTDPDHHQPPPAGSPGPLADVFTGVTKPLGGWGHSLSTFNGTTPNGAWSLYVTDQYSGSTGKIATGWTLNLTLAAPTVAAPTISGTPQVAQTLGVAAGAVTNGTGSPTFQWNRCDLSGTTCTPIAGATGSTYAVQPADQGSALTVTEFATNSSGLVGSANSAPTAQVAPASNVQVPNQTKATLATSTTKTKQKVLSQGGLLAAFTSNIDGNLVATATVSVPKLSKVYKFTTVKAKVVANNRTTVRLKLSKSGLAAVKKALGKHKKLKAKMKLTVTTASGAVTTVSKTINLAK